MHVLHVVGARPNFMKLAPVRSSLERRGGFRQTVVHTGQHYDRQMADVFFEQLGTGPPDVDLGVGSASHAVQTARIMERLETIVLDHQPDLVLVYGDVNSTLAAALVCSKLGIRLGHVEAGLRSGDRAMPEEINRQLTDRLADLLFTPSADADENLRREGIPAQQIHRVGNVMIDTLVHLSSQARLPVIEQLADRYLLVTLHRPANVDDPQRLATILRTIEELSSRQQVVFPVHPRTRGRIEELTARRFAADRLLLTGPLGYLEFLALQRQASAVVTDSGGIQEETTFLGVPCLTLRNTTERPVTVSEGTNTLIGDDVARLGTEVERILAGRGKTGRIPDLWDGRAAQRIADVLAAL